MDNDEIIWILGICVLACLGLGIILMILIKAYNKITCGMCHSFRSMKGKTVIITGANRGYMQHRRKLQYLGRMEFIPKEVRSTDKGIGKETALDLALREAKVIMACRNLTNGREAAEEIIRRTGNQQIHVKYLDISSLHSVRTFASDILKSESRLDVLIHNAGVIGKKNKCLTEENYELMFATNYLGPFVLTCLLLDLMKKSAPARIVNVSTMAYVLGKIDTNNLNSEKSYNRYFAYCNSKLALILFTKQLAEKLDGTGVTVNCLHPGVVDTELFRHFFFLARWIIKLNMWLFFKTPKEGAQTVIYLAISEEVAGVSGKYYVDCKRKSDWAKANDMTVAKQLWEATEKLVEQNTV